MNISARVYNQPQDLVRSERTITGVRHIEQPVLDLTNPATLEKQETLQAQKHDLLVKLDDDQAIHVSFSLDQPVNRSSLLAQIKRALEGGQIRLDTQDEQLIENFEQILCSEPLELSRSEVLNKSQELDSIVLERLEGLKPPSQKAPELKAQEILTLQKIFGEVPFEAFEKIGFDDIDASLDPKSHICIEEGGIKLNTSLASALTTFVKQCPQSSEKLILELRQLQLDGTSKTPLLENFIKYQVYKTGVHVMSEDDMKWSRDIALEVRQLYPEQTQNVTNEQLAKIISGHYMCKTKFSEPMFTLLRTDTPAFVLERFKRTPVVSETPGLHIIEGSYSKGEDAPIPAVEVLYDCNSHSQKDVLGQIKEKYGESFFQANTGVLAKMLEGKKLPDEKEAQAYALELMQICAKLDKEDPEIKNIAKHLSKIVTEMESPDEVKKYVILLTVDNFKLTPFDARVSEPVMLQVPVMAQPLEIELPDQTKLVIGQGPESMGIRMTDEDAGVFRRSYNSQRVIEVGEFDSHGKLQVFQMKGAGVPEYGFNLASYTGGEYFDLATELDAGTVRDFSMLVGPGRHITPNCLGQVNISSPDKTTVLLHDEPKERRGAITFRIDESSGGLRMENVPKPQKPVEQPVERIEEAPRRPSPFGMPSGMSGRPFLMSDFLQKGRSLKSVKVNEHSNKEHQIKLGSVKETLSGPSQSSSHGTSSMSEPTPLPKLEVDSIETIESEPLQPKDVTKTHDLTLEEKKQLLSQLKSGYNSGNMSQRLENESRDFKQFDYPGYVESVRQIVRNSALSNLLGIKYDDQNCLTLADLGLNGEFFDTGGIGDLTAKDPNKYQFKMLTISTEINKLLTGEDIDDTYKEQFFSSLNRLTESDQTLDFHPQLQQMRLEMKPLKAEVLQKFCGYLGDKNDDEGQSVKIAFRRGGLPEYAQVLLQQWEIHKSEFTG